jgi:putative endonuclease
MKRGMTRIKFHRHPTLYAWDPLAPSVKPRHLSRMKGGWVYIVTNQRNGTLYVGVTADIARRAWEHREGVAEGFTKRYGLKRLVYVERHEEITDAIQREKRMKSWPRAWKINLIREANPNWNDLYQTLL